MTIVRQGAPDQRGPLPPITHRRHLRLTSAQSAILDRLADQPQPCTVSVLAALLHQHPNTIREHLDVLVTVGAAHRTPAPSVGRGRPAWLYEATTDPRLSDDAREYAGLAAALAAHIARTSPHPAADADAAGMEWGRTLVRTATAADAAGPAGDHAADPPSQDPDLHARRRVVALVDELGFSPEADAGATVVRLRRCPLLNAAHQHPEVVCGVHLGLVRGALSELGASADLALIPFAESGACVLQLSVPPTA